MTPEAQQGANPYFDVNQNSENIDSADNRRKFLNLRECLGQNDAKNGDCDTPNKTQSDITGTLLDEREANGRMSNLILSKNLDSLKQESNNTINGGSDVYSDNQNQQKNRQGVALELSL